MINQSFTQSLLQSQLAPPPPPSLQRQSSDPAVLPLLNLTSILTPLSFLLISLLIVFSISSVHTRQLSLQQHQRQLALYFNLNILGMDNLGFYEDSDNIDEDNNQFDNYQDMQKLLRDIVNVSKSYGEDGIVDFQVKRIEEEELEEEDVVEMEVVYRNQTIQTLSFNSTETALEHFQDFATDKTRDLLLLSQVITIECLLGDSIFADNFKIEATLEMHDRLMVQTTLQYGYSKVKPHIGKRIGGLRTLQIALAVVLLWIFITKLLQNKQKMSQIQDKTSPQYLLQLKYRSWFLFLSVLCLLIVISSKMTALCSWLLLLPLFEHPQPPTQQTQQQYYNFNKNIRYSFTLIIKIWLPLLLCLNGFIYLSMLLYSNSDSAYFGDYFRAFFDYMYQMFQCGTYQIFTQMQGHGYLSQMLYSFLYFYVFMVGTALIPAFFVTLIQMRITQRDIKIYTGNLLRQAVCPQCHNKNIYTFNTKEKMVDLIVQSSKLSPLVQKRQLMSRAAGTTKNNDNVLQGSKIEIVIQQSQNGYIEVNQRYKMSGKFVRYNRKILRLVRQLEERARKERNREELQIMLAAVLRGQQLLTGR